MYNIYSAEKTEKELDKFIEKQKKISNIKSKRKELMPVQIKNYEERIKNFMLQMVNDPVDLNNQRNKTYQTNPNNFFTKRNEEENNQKSINKIGNHFGNEFNHKTNQDLYYNYTHYNKPEEIKRDNFLIEKINKQNDEHLLEREMMGNIKKRFAVNKMKQKFEEERKVRSIVKNKAIDSFRSTGKKNYFPKPFSSDTVTDKNFISNLNSNKIRNQNSSDPNILNSRNEENSEFYIDSPPPNINMNKMTVTANKFDSMSDIKKNINTSNSIKNTKVIHKTLSSTINGYNKNNVLGRKQSLDPVQYIQRNSSGNQFLKSTGYHFNEIMGTKRNGFDAFNGNFDMEEYFNLMNLNNHQHNEDNSSTDFNVLNKYLNNNIKESAQLKSQISKKNKTQQSFYESPNRKNQFFGINEMRNLEVLKKLAFKEEQRKIIYETEDAEY